MNLQQLRYLHEIAKQGLNISEAAAALFTSQPGVSKQVKLLEEELGVTVFERNGKRLTAVTEPGRHVLEIVERMLRDMQNLRRVGEQFSGDENGSLEVATTHTQARYILPQVVKRFVERFPRVRLRLHQGNPAQVTEWVNDGVADIGIATEALDQSPRLVTLPCYQWSHTVVVPPEHPLLSEKAVSLATLARYPLITYDPSFTGRTRIDRGFERAGVTPDIVLTAVDSDVIKTYVELGLGVGIIAEMAFDAARDTTLRAVAAGHLFESNTTRLGVRHDAWLRKYEFAFIEFFAPHLGRKVVEAALKGGGEDLGL
jgi:LysR family cys regulon transcriptional activator